MDFFQTCTDDQAGCLDDRKENIFSCDHFYQLWPFVDFSNKVLWHQLLINYFADFFQFCTDDQAGCVDDRKEKIFSCGHFYQSYGPLLILLIKLCGINSTLSIWQNFLKLAQMIRHDV
jgi:hypothetical protein